MMAATIVVPTFNEEGNISRLILALKRLYPDVHILVVDDGSSDGTQEEVRRVSGDYNDVELLDRSKSKVKGLTASVLEAASRVQTQKMVVMDSDFQHPPEKVGELVRGLDSHGVVVGTREGTPGWSLSRKIISWGATALARLRLSLSVAPKVKDPMSGFFAVRTKLFTQTANLHRRGFVGQGFKVLFDFLKYLPRGTKVGAISYTFGLRTAGESKISRKQMVCMFKSLLR